MNSVYKYSILTFIIGNGYEKVHEICNKQSDVEYLLVTDDRQLKSSTWKIIYDESLTQYKSPFERCFRVRYNPFKYCSTDICITVDGSMHIKGSLDKLIDKFNDEKYDLCLMPHPLWNDICTEYDAWIKMRNYPVKQAFRAITFFKQNNYDFKYKGLFQLCFSIKRNTAIVNKIDTMTFECLQKISENGEFERLDQTIYTYVVNKYFNDINVLPVSEQIVRSSAIQWYWHNSDKPNNNWFMTPGKPDIKYVFNKQVKCFQLL